MRIKDVGRGHPAVSPTHTLLTAYCQLKLCLEAAGTSLEKVIKSNVYCNDPVHFQTINAVYARYFPTDPSCPQFRLCFGLARSI